MTFISEFRAAGGEASIANGLDQALRTLETWGLLADAQHEQTNKK